MNVSLVMIKSDGARREFPVDKDRVVIGRTTSCDLRIPISSVSRQHCELTTEGDKIVLRDLGSSNGTFHNDTRIQEATLSAGDKISVGPVVFRLLIDGQPADVLEAHAAPAKPEIMPVNEGEEVLAVVDEDDHSPTVDLDDPIAALEALADATETKPASAPAKPAAPSAKPHAGKK